MQYKTICQLIYAYSSCLCLLGVKQLAGNLLQYCCISIKVFIFRRAHTISKKEIRHVCPSICLSVCTEQFCCHRTVLYEILYLKYFRKYVEKIYLSKNLSRIIGTSREDVFTFMISRLNSSEYSNIWDKFVEKNKSQVLYLSNIF
jgi:hypothetical protein